MNSKERVLRSIRHQEVDRTPSFYLGAPKAKVELCKKLGINNDADEESLLSAFDVDVRYVMPRFLPGGDHFGFSYGSVHAQIHGHADNSSDSCFPLEACKTVDEVRAWNWPSPDWYEYKLPQNKTEVYQEKAIVAYDMGIIFLAAMGLRGIEGIMLDMAGEPEMADAIFAGIAKFNMGRTRQFLESNRGLIDIVGIGDDVAGQNGMLMSVEMWRRFLKPHIMDMVNLCREFNVVPYFHGCGGFRALFPDFIEMGIPCVGRLQTEARGNNFKEIKEEFGKDLCLWGGIDGQHIMIEGRVKDVEEHVAELLKIGAINSGYVAGPTHSFTDDTPAENIIAAYRALSGRTRC
ncbi:MAG: hypothetical protein A2X49_05975 [Lentisphaerae bacterium GWF2_52_8]|nr:MAG: hypothetical protein A2X49_05975 [Lentisphaerae bacterium GWF2_52_8]